MTLNGFTSDETRVYVLYDKGSLGLEDKICFCPETFSATDISKYPKDYELWMCDFFLTDQGLFQFGECVHGVVPADGAGTWPTDVARIKSITVTKPITRTCAEFEFTLAFEHTIPSLTVRGVKH